MEVNLSPPDWDRYMDNCTSEDPRPNTTVPCTHARTPTI
jgi:hypothetical protein